MTLRAGGKAWRVRLFALAALAVALAAGGGLIGVAATTSPAPLASTTHSGAAQVSGGDPLQEAALEDLHLLRAELTFKPLLPPSLALPSGHRYNRVVWAGAPVTGFGIFISSQDPTAGSRAIHMDEALLSSADLADPRYPMNAFRSILRPVTLGNGVWFEMQQQHAPWQGEWILMAVHGTIAIQIDGFDSKQLLEGFAATLARSS